jgi:hypothetical protein
MFIQEIEKMYSFNSKTVSWEVYADSGALKYVSKSHFRDIDNPSFTLCGLPIPNNPEGYDSDVCGRCLKKAGLSEQ